MPRHELLHSVLELMGSTFRTVRSSVSISAEVGTLSPSEMRILFHVGMKKEEGASIKELAETMNVSSSAATQFVDKLVEKELLCRHDNLSDRRGVCVTLSEKARRTHAAFKKEFLKQAEPLFEDIPDADLEHLIEILSKVKNKK